MPGIGIGIGMGKAALMPLPIAVRSIFSKYGSNAHLYLPGVGVVSGFTAGNYQDSAGTTVATVDNPVGLILDAAGSVGAELNSVGFAAWTLVTATLSSGSLFSTGGTQLAYKNLGLVANKSYRITFDYTMSSGSSIRLNNSATNGAAVVYTTPALSSAGRVSVVITPTTGNVLSIEASGAAFTGSVSNLSAVEVTGIHASQSTAGYRPVERVVNGKACLQFDGVDDRLSLSAPLFQMSDDFVIVAPIKASQAATWGTAFGQTLNASGTPRIQLGVDGASGKALAYLRDDAGTNTGNILSTTTVNNTAAVVTLWKVGNTKYLRVNGVTENTNSTVLGTATFDTYSIGALKQTTDHLTGNLYDLIPVKGTFTIADVVTLEKFAAQQSGVTL